MKCFNNKLKELKESAGEEERERKKDEERKKGKKKKAAAADDAGDEEMRSMKPTSRTLERIRNLLFVHSPTIGFPHSQKLIAQFVGREDALLESLLRKYRVEGEPAYKETLLARVESVLRDQYATHTASSRVAWIRAGWETEWEGKETTLWSSILRGPDGREPIPAEDLVAVARGTIPKIKKTPNANHDLDEAETEPQLPSPKVKFHFRPTSPDLMRVPNTHDSNPQVQREFKEHQVPNKIHESNPLVPRPDSIDEAAELRFLAQLGFAACSGDSELLSQRIAKFNTLEKGLPVG
jgi:hypothetical protein